jgi:hypothetical protein
VSLPQIVSVAAPTLFGTSHIHPKEHAGKWALLFAIIGVGAGVTGITLANKGKMEEALTADAISIIFDLMSIVKAVEIL